MGPPSPFFTREPDPHFYAWKGKRAVVHSLPAMGTGTKRLAVFCLWTLPLLPLAGCANISPIPESLRKQAKDQPLFSQIAADPAAYKGRMVIFGGRIIESRVYEKGSIVLISQRPLSRHDRPVRTAESGGRILVEYTGRLDPAVYSPGKRITVAGRVLAGSPLPRGPTIRIEGVHFCLWPHEAALVEEEQQQGPAAYSPLDEYGATAQYWNSVGWEPTVTMGTEGWW